MKYVINAEASAAGAVAAFKVPLSQGAGVPKVMGYTGTMPNDLGATAETKLFELELDPDSWTTDSSGRLLISAVEPSVGLETGICRWVRWVDGDGTVVIDTDVSYVGGSGFAKLTTLGIVEGDPVEMAPGYVRL
jgi:hypothetical protein